jgi:uncharacterized protein
MQKFYICCVADPSLMEELLKRIETLLHERFSKDSSGHDINHLKRTMNTALKINETEGGDRQVIAVAALLHDVHRIIQTETGKYCMPEDSIPEVEKLLDKAGVKGPQRTRIIHCIKHHEDYAFSAKGNRADDIETHILQDADNLDSIGAIGIGRTFMYCGARNIPMWDPGIPIGREHYDDYQDDPSTVHHFHHKLLRLKDNMNTKTGREMAEHRHNIMEGFLREFMSEWKGQT